MKSLSLFASLLLVCVIISPSIAQTTPEKVAAIRTLMARNHMRETELQTMTNMLQSVRERPDLKSVPPELWDQFGSKLDSLSGVILDSAIDVYAKYYTLEDINELIKIYENPVMQKSIKLMPQMFTELAAIGGRIGRETVLKLMEEETTTPTHADTPSKPHH